MSASIEKVLGYITRFHNGSRELLVFEHVEFPDAGIQVPAGTVKSGETSEAAVLREVTEEIGLETVCIEKFLGKFEYFYKPRSENHRRNVFLIKCDQDLPQEWINVVKSDDDDKELKFKVYWLQINEAKIKLEVGQGDYLDFL